MSSPAGHANRACPNPLAGLRGHVTSPGWGEEKGKEGEKGVAEKHPIKGSK